MRTTSVRSLNSHSREVSSMTKHYSDISEMMAVLRGKVKTIELKEAKPKKKPAKTKKEKK